MKQSGLAVYKLDHTQQQMPNTQFLLTHIGATEKWLRGMAMAAAKYGIAKQYGGHISSAFLHSLQLPNANHARVSDDYIPGLRRPANACTTFDPAAPPLYPGVNTKGNILLGRWSLYPWALGIRPYKDAFFSAKQRWANTTCFFTGQRGPESSGYLKPEWWGAQEQFPESQVLVSALAAGPIAPGDGVGDTDVTLVKRTCRLDGVLLKPDRPALSVDRQWVDYVFHDGGEQSGDVTHTRTTLSLSGGEADVGVFVYVLGLALDRDWDVSLTGDIGDLPSGPYVAWERGYGDAFAPPAATSLRAVQVPSGDARDSLQGGQDSLRLKATNESEWGHYTFWRVTPVTCGGHGWALLGELDKFISVSRQRVSAVSVHCGGVTGMALALLGSPGERVQMTFYSPTLKKVQVEGATISDDGVGTVRVGVM